MDAALVVGETRPTTLLFADPPTALAVTAEGASCVARAVPSDSVSCMLAARRVPTDRFADGVPGAGREPSARSWKRQATCSRRVVRRVCSELIMWYRKLTILDRISKRHSRPLDFPLGASRLPTHSAPRDFPLGSPRLPSGSFANPTGKSHSELSAGEWDFQIAARKAIGRTGGAARSPHWDPRLWRGALAGSHSPARGALRASHSEAAPLPCARHFLWGTFLVEF